MSATILVVDDQPMFERLIRNMFRDQIEDGIYDFVFALNGKEALDALEQNNTIDMVLSDINMPQMDGLTFLGKVKDIRPGLKVVMVSAYGDMPNIRKAMNFGAYDFIPKPIEFEDLEATIQKTLKESAVLKQAEKARELAVENEQLQALDQLKSRFFTNISHEFRTPLTVISGMAEQILENEGQWPKNEGITIRRNSNILLDLVNQILDLRKLEAGKIEPKPVQSDIIAYLKYIADSFYYFAERKDIQFQFESDTEKLVLDFDPEKLLRIVSNLLSNAIKFTPEGGSIVLHVQSGPDSLAISVQDSGVGISPEDISSIFERYFQVLPSDKPAVGTEGTGIGLALAKQLTDLLDWEITVQSTPGQGSTFRLQLPRSNQASVVETGDITGSAIDHSSSPESAPPLAITAQEAAGDALPVLLIVEDNPDVTAYLRTCLEDQYRLMTATNGQEGIDMALESVPDIIISDVMMPEKDGFELCQTIKADERTSHIPIILLTAKAEDEARLTGLERGADAYLNKPFNKQELFLQLRNLLRIRQELQSRYSQPGATLPEQDERFNHEDQFVEKVRQAILDNIDDEYYGIQELCRDVAMSRSNLHLKLKSLTGRSTSHFIRAVRLSEAQKMLRTSDMTISEVAFAVGFNDPSYFSRTYREEFGQNPKSARE
ncbi:MAG: response regulator [Bacteroidetes bacterium]|nr:MAG: response regulator [Bacteroidota bacterium]